MPKPPQDFSVFIVGKPAKEGTLAPAAPATPRPRQVLSLGQVDALRIPDDLAYAGAMRALQHSARGLAIGIRLSTFYSEVPIELHNFVDTITYRFLVENGVPLLAYWVSTHFWGNYAEVNYEGYALRSWSNDIPSNSQHELRAQARRIEFTLGIPA